ncbi:MAG: hypothetical protein HS109_19190 [Burkholderiales bacterium]|nr:hypothetical protein [Burkholderiales bacterium]
MPPIYGFSGKLPSRQKLICHCSSWSLRLPCSSTSRWRVVTSSARAAGLGQGVQRLDVDLDGRGGIEAAAHVVGARTGQHAVRRTALGGERQQRLDLRDGDALRRLRVEGCGKPRREQAGGERASARGDGWSGGDGGHGPK